MTEPALELSRCKVVVLGNAGSGRRNAQAARDEVEAALRPATAALEYWSFQNGRGIEAAAHRAVKEGAGLVVAFGGDGTQSAVAAALAGGSVPMGVLPGGTFNYFARDLGIGESLPEALATLLRAERRAVDLGVLNGRAFLNNVSFGIYPAILERREAIYRRWGRSRMAAYLSVLLALRDLGDPLHLTVIAGGVAREIHTPLAFVGCNAHQLESLGLSGTETVRDKHFTLFLARSHSRPGLAAAAFRLALGRSRVGEDFDLVEADEIWIEKRRHGHAIAIDGEKLRLSGPYHLRVERDALCVIAPPRVKDRTGPAGEGG